MKNKFILVALWMFPNALFGQSLTIGPSTLDFGNVQVGTSSQSAFVIQHILNAPAASGTVNVDNSAFQIVSGGSFSLSGSQSDVVLVQFTPNAAVSYNGNATFSTAATFSGTNKVKLTGIGTQPPPTGGAVTVKATLDGVPWTGNLTYALTGPSNFFGDTVPADFQNRLAGTYVFSVGSGGPPKSYLWSINPVNAQTLPAGTNIIFTVSYSSVPSLAPLPTNNFQSLNISFNAKSIFLYILEFTESLAHPSWTPIRQALGNDASIVLNAPIDSSKTNGSYRVVVQNPQGILSFPLQGLSPYSAEIAAVFDHSAPTGCSNGMVEAFTGEIANSTNGISNWSGPGESTSCPDDVLHGYSSGPIAMKQKFIVNTKYTGGSTNSLDGPNTPYYLFYDGHTGYDYPATNGTPFLAAMSGIVIKVVFNSNDFTTNEIEVTNANTYTTHYLHFSKPNVTNGQQVFESVTQLGEVGLGHLHFTVKKHGDRVDPYGWKGMTNMDPSKIDGHDNVPLWKAVQ